MRDVCLLFGDKLHPHVQLMMDLGKAMGDEGKPTEPGTPNPQQRIDRCVAALKEAAGEEILANAAGVVALFSAMTIVVDVTGQKADFSKMQKYASKFLRWKKNVLSCFCVSL